MKDRYIGTNEIRARTGLSKAKVNEIMHMFEYRGQMYRVGTKLLVKERIFEDWLEHECRVEGVNERRMRRVI